MNRKIIHCDADCFYAAIEMRDNPALRELPLAVGGRSDRRGVIATCNYLARSFGVRSAMATATAKRLCPDLRVVAPDMAKYRAASVTMRETFLKFTELIEPLSLDEAYLDVTDSPFGGGSATKIAQQIRADIVESLGITVSAGVSNTKFMAKIASDWNKPNGLCVIPPDQVDQFLLSLPVNKIHGVGKVTAAKLNQMGIHTCAELRLRTPEELQITFGKFGPRLFELAHGIDPRPVTVSRQRKSISTENTFSSDLIGIEQCLAQLESLMTNLQRRLDTLPSDAKYKNAFVKVKFSDFSTTTLERAGTTPSLVVFQQLLIDAIARKPLPVRLLGVGVRLHTALSCDGDSQLELFPESTISGLP